MEDTHPTAAKYTLTSRHKAMAIDGEQTDSDQSIYLVVLQGHFTWKYARVPSGAPLPKGNVVELTIDAVTHQPLDIGILQKEPSGNSSLGNSHSFLNQLNFRT